MRFVNVAVKGYRIGYTLVVDITFSLITCTTNIHVNVMSTLAKLSETAVSLIDSSAILCAPQVKNSPRYSQKCVGGWGSAPDPAGGANGAPPDPLAGIPPLPTQFPPWSLGV